MLWSVFVVVPDARGIPGREGVRCMEAFLHLELLLQPGVTPPTGMLHVPGHPQVPFSGYLELLAAIERVTTEPVSEPGSAQRRGAS